jgi:sirohydrochlorin cobaltochelatase
MTKSSPTIVPSEAQADLEVLEARIKAILPPQYQDCYEEVSPNSMGSANLKYEPDGRVAWDEIWTDFCDLSLAGGPPHRGLFLEPCFSHEVTDHEKEYQAVVNEMGRGIWLVTSLPVIPRFALGWIGVRCASDGMAAWLHRAVVVENVMARRQGNMLLLPAGPCFRLEKEIKNVITALAKTCHYWSEHMFRSQKESVAPELAAAELLESATREEIEAEPDRHQAVLRDLEQGIHRILGIAPVPNANPGWLGIPCQDDRMAIWLMRALVVDNVLARREGAVLCVPAGPHFSVNGRLQRLL